MGNGCVKNQIFPELTIINENIIRKPVIETSTHLSLRKANVDWGKQNVKGHKKDRNPTCVPKADVCPSSWQKVDEYAQNNFHSFDDDPALAIKALQKYFKKSIKKVRVVYKWVIEYTRQKRRNFEKNRRKSRLSSGYDSLYDGQTMDVPGPSRLLSVASDIERTPTERFCEICRDLDVKAKVIVGTIKSESYKPGQTLQYNSLKHQWAAVYIKKEWRLVDVDLASRLTEDHITDFYFLTDPEEFVYDHLPEDMTWQLLASPVSQVEFQDMECLKPKFFQLGLKTQNTECVLNTRYGVAEVNFQLPKEKDLHFSFSLKRSDEDSKEDSDDRQMKESVFIEQQRNYNLCCKVYLPVAGKFCLVLSAYDRSTESSDESASICEYLITCNSAKINWTPLPSCERNVWGPTKALTQLGLEPLSHKQGLIYSHDGTLKIVFKSTKKVEVLVFLEAVDESISHLDLTQWTLLRQENGEVIVDVRLLEPGMFVLNIHADVHNDQVDPDLIDMPVACSYLLQTEMPLVGDLQFPDVLKQKAGATPQANRFDIFPRSHVESFFKTIESEIDIIMNTAKDIYFKTKFYVCEKNDRTELEGRILIMRDGHKVTFKLCFPKVGFYLLNLTARKEQEITEDVVFNYVIEVNDTQGPRKRPFPKYFSIWGPKCENYGEEDGMLGTNEEVQLWVKIPGATKVTSYQGSKFENLMQEEDDTWGKMIRTSEISGTELKVLACMDKTQADSFYTFLQYKILDRTEIEELEEKEKAEARIAKEILQQQSYLKKSRLEYALNLERDLQECIEKRDMTKLDSILQAMENGHFIRRYEKLYDQGKDMVEAYRNLQGLISTMRSITKPVIRDLQSCISEPSEIVHSTIVASLLLLGECEHLTKDWSACRQYFNSQTIRQCVSNLFKHGLHPEFITRAQELLSSFSEEDVKTLTAGPKYFYTRSTDILSQLDRLIDGGLDSIQPAFTDRQKEIKSNADSATKA